MIYTALTKKAAQIAYEAHAGQKDKAGMPYIFHPLHLAEQMDDEVSVCVALLHDVAEDTNWTLEELSAYFPEAVMEPLRLLTRKKGVSYFPYIEQLRCNQIARKVKLADLAHNLNMTRFAGCDDFDGETMDKLLKRYLVARDMLEEYEQCGGCDANV